jgi:RNA polymerase sigma factor (sigma-70 family)
MRTIDLLVQSRFKNKVLFDAIFSIYPSVAEFCRDAYFSQTDIGELLNLKRSPVCAATRGGGQRGEYTRLARRIAAYFGFQPEELFPLSLYQLQLPRLVEHGYSSEELLPLLAARGLPALDSPQGHLEKRDKAEKVSRALQELTEREEKVIRMRFGLEDGVECELGVIGAELGISKERVRQIKAKALRKLRHPSRARFVKPYCERDHELTVEQERARAEKGAAFDRLQGARLRAKARRTVVIEGMR